MAFQIRRCLILALCGFVLVVSATGCGRNGPISEVKRNGEDVLARGSAQRVPGGGSRAGRTGALVNFLIGGLILLVIGFLPAVGGFITALATILGFGTLLLRIQALRGRQPV